MRHRTPMLLVVAVASMSVAAASPCSAPADPESLLLEGVRLHEAGEFDEAIAAYRCVLAADPSNVEASYELAYSTFAKAQYGAAIQILDAIAAKPKTAPRGT